MQKVLLRPTSCRTTVGFTLHQVNCGAARRQVPRRILQQRRHEDCMGVRVWASMGRDGERVIAKFEFPLDSIKLIEIEPSNQETT